MDGIDDMAAVLGALCILAGFALWAAMIGIWIWNLVDAQRYTDEQWKAAGQDKTLWIVILVVTLVTGFSIVGSILYLAIPRKRLRALATAGQVYQPSAAPSGEAPSQAGGAQ